MAGDLDDVYVQLRAAMAGAAPGMRMQGKSCFSFKRPEPELFEQLQALTRKGAQLYATPFEPRPHG